MRGAVHGAAKQVLELSIEEAHLLLGLMDEGQSIAASILESLGAYLEEVLQETCALLGVAMQEESIPAPKLHTERAAARG